MLRDIPDWCDGIVVIPVMAGTEIEDYVIYPIKRSKKDTKRYYFSTKWRELDLDLPPKIMLHSPCVIVRDGSVHRLSRPSGRGPYISFKLGRKLGSIEDIST